MGFTALVAGCGVGSDDVTEDGLIKADPDFLAALNDDWPVDPSLYELRDMECIKEPDRIVVSAILINRADYRWAFSPQYQVETTGGETLTEKSGDNFWEPGQEVVISNWFGGTDFHDPPRCQINVLHSAILAWQDDDATKEIYRVLSWNQ